MVLYRIDEVTDDMVLGKSIFLPSGELLLAAGFRLAPRFRARLKQMGFSTVYIQVEGTEDVIPETIINEHIQRELTLSVTKSADNVRDVLLTRRKGMESFRRLIRSQKQQLNKYIAGSGLANTLDTIIQEILSQPSVVLNLSSLQTRDDNLLAHAISVTVGALCIGRRYRFSYEELKQLAMGSVNFDLGLVALPQELVDKKTGRTVEEIEQYRQHTVYGYLMLSQNPAITPTSAVVALQHHERQDASGYPRGIAGENRPPLKDFSRKGVIHRFSEIVAVADAYDLLTTDRGGPKRSPPDAIRKLIEMAGTALNGDIVRALVSIVPAYPVGTRIRVVDAPIAQLNGYYGVVAKVDPTNVAEPQLVLYETRNHQKVKPILVDMAKHKGFVIELIT